MASTNPTTAIQQLWPLLIVRDLEQSIAFYRDKLSFELVGEAKHEGKIYWCRL